MKEKIKGFFSGVACGGAVSVPGLSWSTILVVTGFYDRICRALALDIQTIKKNFLFFVIFITGVLSGIFGFAQLITIMLEHIPLIFYLLLSVLILTCLPAVVKKAYADKKFNIIYLIPIVLGAALIVTLFLAEMLGVEGAEVSPGPFRLILSSAIAGLASIIPGISGSFVLVILGTYETVISAVAGLDLLIIIYTGAGTVLGFVGGSRVITFLLKKYHVTVYSAIIGMIIASVVMLAIDSILKYAI